MTVDMEEGGDIVSTMAVVVIFDDLLRDFLVNVRWSHFSFALSESNPVPLTDA
jgi:hypothetical protein